MADGHTHEANGPSSKHAGFRHPSSVIATRTTAPEAEEGP